MKCRHNLSKHKFKVKLHNVLLQILTETDDYIELTGYDNENENVIETARLDYICICSSCFLYLLSYYSYLTYYNYLT